MNEKHYISHSIEKERICINTEEKAAWFTIVVCTLSLIGFAILYSLYGSPVAFAAFSVLGFTGFTPILFRPRKGDPRTSIDERDRLILRKATVAGGMSSYVIFVLVSMGVWFVQFSQGNREIEISILPFVVLCGGVTLFLTRSIALIVLYRGEGSYGEG
jgi:hypothetical protein